MIKLSDHFTYKKLIQYTFPSVIMLIFTSIYVVIDGLFVSNFVGKTSFAALNFIWPYTMILGGFGFMFGTGGSALIAKTLGEGKKDKANRIFSMIVYASLILSIFTMLFGYFTVEKVAVMLGATGKLLSESVIYGKIFMLVIPFTFLQCEFQSFFPAAQKPNYGLYVTVISGVINILLDALFVVVFKWGLTGAGIASALAIVVGGVIPLIYFARKNNSSVLRLTKTQFHWGILSKTCSNGFSELLNNIAMSIVSLLYNFELLRFAGENGVASYGVLMYLGFVFISIFIGFTIGAAPIISYNYGAQNKKELKNVVNKSIQFVFIFSIIMFAVSEFFALPLSKIFVGYDKELLSMTNHAMRIFAFSFLFSGFAILGSSLFTALNNGPVSAVIAFLRTLVFQVISVLSLSYFFGVEGIWASLIIAEMLASFVAFIFYMKYKKVYNY